MNWRDPLLYLVCLVAGVAGYAARIGLTGPEDAVLLAPVSRSLTGPPTETASPTSTAGNGPYLSRLAKAQAQDMPDLVADYDSIADPWKREDALKGLIARWVELNPREALEFFITLNSHKGVETVLVQWALLEPAAVLAVLQESKAALPRVESILQRLSIIDGKAAVRFLLALPEGKAVPGLLSSSNWRDMVTRMAHADFEGMLRTLDRFAELGRYERHQVIAAIAAGRALSDPDGALEWARGLEKGSRQAVGQVLQTISSWDPARASREFLRTPELMAAVIKGSSEGSLVERIAAQLGRKDPAAALRWIREAVGKEENVRQLAQSAAAQILQQALRDPSRIGEVFTVVQGDLDPGNFMFPRWVAEGKLSAVLEAVSALPVGETRDRLLANLAAQAAASNPMASLKWLEAIADPKAREAYGAQLSLQSGPETSVLARQFYEALPSDLKISAAARLAETQARDHGPAAAGWAQSLPDGAAMEKALASALSVWTSKDSEAASIWVDEMPPGPARDAAATGLVQGILNREPSSAFIWAMSINDPAQQETSLLRTLVRWRQHDAAAASAAVAAAALPEARRSGLLQFIHSNERWNEPAN